MSVYDDFTPSNLMRIGIVFEKENEAKAFIEIMTEEKEVRVGEAIAAGKTKREMDLFEQCKTDGEVTTWLNKYCPQYRDIVKAVQEKLVQELVQHRSEIPGIREITPESALLYPVDFLGVKFTTRDALLKAGLTTVESVVKNYDQLMFLLPDKRLITIREIERKARPYRAALSNSSSSTAAALSPLIGKVEDPDGLMPEEVDDELTNTGIDFTLDDYSDEEL